PLTWRLMSFRCGFFPVLSLFRFYISLCFAFVFVNDELHNDFLRLCSLRMSDLNLKFKVLIRKLWINIESNSLHCRSRIKMFLNPGLLTIFYFNVQLLRSLNKYVNSMLFR